MQPHPASFWVADLSPTGEVKLKADYQHDQLLQLPLASTLIGEFAHYLWREPQGFDLAIPQSHTTLRWRASSDTSGIATLRCEEELSSVCLLLCGRDPQSDLITLTALQKHLLHELHDTGYEPAFDLLNIPERPLIASIHLQVPATAIDRTIFAIADRCLAAAYFRMQSVA
jgi:hypothetical protein